MAWDQVEPTPPHLTYLLLSAFLTVYALFSTFIKNRLHLSEPPIALLVGIILGPRVLGWLNPTLYASNTGLDSGSSLEIGGWGWGDNIIQETARMTVGIQVFIVGLDLPRFYASRHWKSISMMLGPVMTFGWIVCAVFAKFLFGLDWGGAFTIAACLTPTDPVLAASILSNSQFSQRVPKRIKDMLSAESGCNDGISFPFLYIGLTLLKHFTVKDALMEWFLITILWQCVFGTFLGLVIGVTSNKLLRFSDNHGFIDGSAFRAYYLLLAMFCVGVASTLGVDDFLVAFGAGYGFARDGWFTKNVQQLHLPNIIDLMLNSAMFVYIGTIIPWFAFEPRPITPGITPGTLVGFLVLVLLFRRLPIVLATYRWIPDIRTLREALFCGHFGPMGLGGVFLAIEGRAFLENGSPIPDPRPPEFARPYSEREITIEAIWPLVCFIVIGSTMVHGLSVVVMSIYSHFTRPKHLRAGVLAAETDPLEGMDHEGGDGGSIDSYDDETDHDSRGS